jgi:hypothetical protein
MNLVFDRNKESAEADADADRSVSHMDVDKSLQQAEEFWAEQDICPHWTVPIAHGGSMPWLKPHERGLLLAMNRAHQLGKTPLLIDTADKVCDTFFSYQASLVLEAKKLVLDCVQKRQTREQALEHCRTQLVSAMRYGQTLYVRLADSACDFNSQFSSEDAFPLAVFDRECVAALQEYREGTGSNLWQAPHPLARVLREGDLTQGIFQPRFAHKARESDGSVTGFEVVVCTQFASEDVLGFLADSLPMSSLQAIKLLPSSVRIKYNHYNKVFELGVGGTLRWEDIDELYAISFVFKGDFDVRLLEEAVKGPAGATPPSSDAAEVCRNRSGTFSGLRGGATYVLTVEEDAAAEEAARSVSEPRLSAAQLERTRQAASKMHSKPSATALPGRSDDGRTQASELLAAELRGLSVNEIAERSVRYQALKEAADLQDIVFGA